MKAPPLPIDFWLSTSHRRGQLFDSRGNRGADARQGGPRHRGMASSDGATEPPSVERTHRLDLHGPSRPPSAGGLEHVLERGKDLLPAAGLESTVGVPHSRFAWLRRPASSALRRTIHLARTTPRDRVTLLAFWDAVRSLVSRTVASGSAAARRAHAATTRRAANAVQGAPVCLLGPRHALHGGSLQRRRSNLRRPTAASPAG